jgi:hypothetical protein
MTPQPLPPHADVLQIISGLWVASAVSCLARFGIPDLVKDGPKSPEELAGKIGAQPGALYRLMRATASVGILSEGTDGRFSQTPRSDVLRSDSHPSLRHIAIMNTDEWHMRGWERIDYCVRTGKQALDEVYGMPLFEYFQKNREPAETFNQAMSSMSSMEGPAVASAYDFSGIGSIVDVAGGHGLLLALILEKNPRLKATLYDMPQVIEGARTGPLQPMMNRCTLTSGNMFESVPTGADAYMMKHIIHDWPDDLCLKILKGCRAGVNSGGRLLVVDPVIPKVNDFSTGKIMDIEMLIFPGGHERTEEQFRALFVAAGWRVSRIIPTDSPVSIVEGLPA